MISKPHTARDAAPGLPGRLPDEAPKDTGYDGPSKSQLKREMHALQALGVELVALPKDPLAKMPMPDKLADAVREARRITSHEGRRRQIQYIGKVMRGLPEDEVKALQHALDSYNGVNAAQTAQLHAVERWRERLLADDAALTEFLRLHPLAEPQQGRTMIRNARREMAANRPPKNFRALFQWIKDAQSGSATTGTAPDTGAAVEPGDEEQV